MDRLSILQRLHAPPREVKPVTPQAPQPPRPAKKPLNPGNFGRPPALETK